MLDQKITRLATALYAVSWAGVILIPVLYGLFLVAFGAGLMMVELPEDTPTSGPFFWMGLAVGAVPVAVLVWVLDKLRRLFDRYRKDQVLTDLSAQLILKTGQGLLWLAVLSIIVQPIQSVLLTWNAPPGERELSIGLGTAEIGFFFAAGLLTLIGWAMRDAARQAEENKGFV